MTYLVNEWGEAACRKPEWRSGKFATSAMRSRIFQKPQTVGSKLCASYFGGRRPPAVLLRIRSHLSNVWEALRRASTLGPRSWSHSSWLGILSAPRLVWPSRCCGIPASVAGLALIWFTLALTVFLFGMGLANPLWAALALQPFGDRAGLLRVGASERKAPGRRSAFDCNSDPAAAAVDAEAAALSLPLPAGT